MPCIVYRHVNVLNGKSYVGMTSFTMLRRWMRHAKLARQGSKCHFHRAIALHGPGCWKHEVLEICGTPEQVKHAEREWIARLRSMGELGYNSTIGGDGVMTGRKFSLEARQRMSQSRRGRKFTVEACTNVRRAMAVLAPEKRQKIIEASRRAHHKRVARCDPATGAVLQVYPSVTAVQADGFEKTTVAAAARGVIRSSGGFAWRYLQKEESC